MAKDDVINISGEVVDVLPAAMFKVEISGGQIILAYLGGKLRQNNIRIINGDKVELEMSPYDLKRGRIVYRHRWTKLKN